MFGHLIKRVTGCLRKLIFTFSPFLTNIKPRYLSFIYYVGHIQIIKIPQLSSLFCRSVAFAYWHLDGANSC